MVGGVGGGDLLGVGEATPIGKGDNDPQRYLPWLLLGIPFLMGLCFSSVIQIPATACVYSAHHTLDLPLASVPKYSCSLDNVNHMLWGVISCQLHQKCWKSPASLVRYWEVLVVPCVFLRLPAWELPLAWDF